MRAGLSDNLSCCTQSNGAALEDAICSCSVSGEPNAWRGKRSLQRHLGTIVSWQAQDMSRDDKAKNQYHNYVQQLRLSDSPALIKIHAGSHIHSLSWQRRG
jgi:hypothetical protein